MPIAHGALHKGGSMIHRQQNEILTNAKKRYPHFKLKDWSEKTGIQLTRVFRLFHGREMTLNEYMSFHTFLNGDESYLVSKSFRDFTHICNKSLEFLPTTIIDQITLNLKYHLENYFIQHGKIKEIY